MFIKATITVWNFPRKDAERGPRFHIRHQHFPVRSDRRLYRIIFPLSKQNHPPLPPPKQQLEDYGQNVRGDHRHLQVLYRLQQPDRLRLERPLGGMASHVIHVVESVSGQKSFSVQYQEGVGKKKPCLIELGWNGVGWGRGGGWSRRMGNKEGE